MYFWKYILAKKAGLSQKKCNMALYGLPVLPIAEVFEKTVTGNPISVSDALAQDALSLQVSFTPTQDGTPSIDSEPTTEPYLSKAIPRGNKEYYSLVGGTVAWNQLVPDAQAHKSGTPTSSHWESTTQFELIQGHKYLLVRSGTYSAEGNGARVVSVASPTIIYDSCKPKSGSYQASIFNCTETRNSYYIQAYVVNDEAYDFYLNVHDLTLLFANNPAIADYAYSLEQSSAGSGIAWLKSYGFFTEEYYAYNPGELISVNTSGHKTVGFNQWDEQWENENIDIDANTGLLVPGFGNVYFRSKNHIPIFPNTVYYDENGSVSSNYRMFFYDADKNYISYISHRSNTTFTTPTNAHYMLFRFSSSAGFSYQNDICINISDREKNGTYKPYIANTYPIDPTDLRGLFKLDSANKLTCEGDTHKPDGTVTRKFEYRAYQSGDESLTNAITDGTHTVVKLATPTTESATPYTSPIDVEAGGTEEFVDSRTVQIPVGNETYYASEFEVHGKTGVTVSHGATEDDPNPTEYEVEFTQQGTVYGGTVDIVTGVLTVTWAILSNPQNLHWISNSSQGMKNFQTASGTVSKKSGSNNWKCSRYSNGFIGTDKAEGIFIFNSGEVCIRDYRYWEHGGTSAEEAAFKASLADVTIAYELATPLTYQLTPQQVQMLLGDNYLTTEDGTITLTYMAGK